ncbi:MAG: hypothetical protein ACRCXZ_07305, partial [Patescibacteria group bacterium]
MSLSSVVGASNLPIDNPTDIDQEEVENLKFFDKKVLPTTSCPKSKTSLIINYLKGCFQNSSQLEEFMKNSSPQTFAAMNPRQLVWIIRNIGTYPIQYLQKPNYLSVNLDEKGYAMLDEVYKEGNVAFSIVAKDCMRTNLVLAGLKSKTI